MWAYIFFALFFGTFIAFLVVINVFTRRISELERQRAELQVEEDRVFDFLHGLGEAFSEGVRSSELHRLIVESATRILDAHGGVLYLMDKNDSLLAPAFISKGCPALLNVPSHILDQADSNPVALDSYLRLSTVKRGEGVIGAVFKSGQARMYTEAELAAELPAGSIFAHSAIVGPLIYRRKILGIIGLANGPMSTPFSEKDLTVFKTIAEQSAFALYNEVIYLEAGEKKRLDHDLEIAREIQSILLPSSPPKVEGYELSGINIPAKQVSGDYYDYIQVDEHRMGVAIADVSGKGVPASLIMAMCRSVIRSEAIGRLSAAEVLCRVNQQLYPDIKEDMFISMAYLILDTQTNSVTLARAGHDAPLWYRAADKSVEKLTPKGMALGIDSGEVFNGVCADFSFELAPNDCLLLYTDGATEALDDEGLEFGIPRLVQGLQASSVQGAASIIKRLTGDVKSFVGNYPQHDDITLIAIRKR
ncbi:MAG TPA: GAF domain-containing SpoIIE family protein phosphatase [Chthoniobacteraceae bacterium]|nr:GAF domain-containing SpoIIE family protein phosphatase [Chthoniobacteraceae bacterium]